MNTNLILSLACLELLSGDVDRLDEGEGLVSVVGDGVRFVQLQLEEVPHRAVLALQGGGLNL